MSRCIVTSLYSLILVAAATNFAIPIHAQDADAQEALGRGLVRRADGIAPGYTLISPFSAKHAYLIDADGQVVHQWESRFNPGLHPYLLPNGNLLRGIQVGLTTRFQGGGISGGFQEFNWDGDLQWEFHVASDLRYHHHDIEPMPNGNFLMIAWETRSKQEAIDVGRLPEYVNEAGIWPESILEIEPLKPLGARVVWEWHLWDHLIQDTDESLPNYGVVADHPERFNVNGDIPRAEREEDHEEEDVDADGKRDEEADDQAADGDAADEDDDDDQQQAQRRRNQRTDWLHFNGLDYNGQLDQIVVSSHSLSEVWIIDHSTTTEEAAGSSGGRSGRGGDLLYRWGNPQVYERGEADDQQLFHQHNPEWIPAGLPGAGNVTIFNNGSGRTGGENYSTVEEIQTPLQEDGTYAIEESRAFGPESPAWRYDPDEDDRFFASFISGAHRLSNGNTLVCSGPDGRVLEVTAAGEVVWEYKNPFAVASGNAPPNDNTFSMFRATRIPPDHPALEGKALAPIEPQPKTAHELFAERQPPEDSPTGWQSLTSIEDGMPPWTTVLGAEGRTLQLQPDPDNDGHAILLATGEATSFARSHRPYENFILELEWKLAEEGGDAGVLVWADPLPAVSAPAPRGVEIDIFGGEESGESTAQGAVFAIEGAQLTPDPQFRVAGERSIPKEDQAHVRPAGQWNRYRVTAVDGTVTLEVNDHLVAGGLQCRPSRGYLGLVSNRGEVQYRNARIWELPAGAHAAGEADAAHPASSHRPLYNGVDLEGWKVLRGDWQADDWRMTCGAGSSEIEIKLPEGAKGIRFDFKRAGGPGDGGKLPLEIGGARFDATGEVVGQWNRVLVDFNDEEVAVEIGGARQTIPRGEAGALRMALLNDGGAAEFANVFVQEE